MSLKPIAFASLAVACLLAGCDTGANDVADAVREAAAQSPSSSAAHIEPIPPIPAALRGCWETDGPEDPEEPGAPHRVIVTDTSIEVVGEGMPRRVATAEFVDRVGDTAIEGRFSAPEGNSRATVATALSLGDGGDGGPLGMLRLAEGDAGSSFYSRCTS